MVRKPLPGANDGAALITDIIANRLDLTGGDVDHVGSQVVTGNRTGVDMVRHQ
jgi:hypothetical protein